MSKMDKEKNHEECLKLMLPVRDALDVISGKWKILILISIMHGNSRFRKIEKSIPKITSKVLAKELKDLEEHKLIKRTVYDDYPVKIEYTITEYAISLEKVMNELHIWGLNHRKKISENI
jgi:DNA-binding HxlR family transcriptional regulator